MQQQQPIQGKPIKLELEKTWKKKPFIIDHNKQTNNKAMNHIKIARRKLNEGMTNEMPECCMTVYRLGSDQNSGTK